MKRRQYLSLLGVTVGMSGCSSLHSGSDTQDLASQTRPLESLWATANADPQRTRHVARDGKGLDTSQRPTLIQYNPSASLVSAPVCGGNSVFYTTGTEVVAEGRLSWSRREDGAGLAPVLHKGTLFATVSDELVALDAQNGAEQWRRNLATDAGAAAPPPTVVADTLVTVTRGNVTGFTLGGEQSWQASNSAKRPSQLAASEQGIIAAGISENGAVVEGYTIDGIRKWEYGLPPTEIGSDMFVCLMDRQGCVLTDKGRLLALDIKDGARQWQMQLPAGIIGRPTVADGLIIIPASAAQTTVHAVNIKQGSVAWTRPVSNQSFSLATVGEDVLIPLNSSSNKVLVSSLGDGSVLTTYRLDDELPPGYAIKKISGGGTLVQVEDQSPY